MDNADAWACARGRPKDHHQAKGGPKGGLNSIKNINILIYSIYLVNYGAPTRTRTADLLITNQLLYQLSYRGIEWPFNAITKIVQEAFMLLLKVLQLC